VANNGGDDGTDKGLVRMVTSLTADLDVAAAVADSTWGRVLSWWMCFRVLGGWRGDGGAAVLRPSFYRCWECF
jgi:hypothetical protein